MNYTNEDIKKMQEDLKVIYNQYNNSNWQDEDALDNRIEESYNVQRVLIEEDGVGLQIVRVSYKPDSIGIASRYILLNELKFIECCCLIITIQSLLGITHPQYIRETNLAIDLTLK